MDSPSSDVETVSSDDGITAPLRWVVPDEVLELAHNWQVQHNTTCTLAMPAEEQEWRDHQHYRAYVREVFDITTLQENA